MSCRAIALTLLWCSVSLGVLAQPEQSVQNLIMAVEGKVKEKAPNAGELKLLRTRLEVELPALKAAATLANPKPEAQEWYSRAGAAVKVAEEKIKAVENPSIADLIGSTKPMTAVLFSSQDRNSFEVVKDPMSADDTIGIINQSQEGSTAGILIAAEAPFAFPKIRWKGNDYYSSMPIGAWFGVNLQTGGGDDISDVDLAAGLSISFISAERFKKLEEGGSVGLTGSARLLIGVVYGEVATLGPRDAGTVLKSGDPYPLGESPPLSKDKRISFTYGIGFRF